MRIPMVRRDRECPFREDLIAKESGVFDTQLRVPPEVCPLLDVLQLAGSYEPSSSQSILGHSSP